MLAFDQKHKSFTPLLAAILIMLTTATAGAQGLTKMQSGQSTSRGIELAGFYGWQYGGDFTAYQGEIELEDTENFGGMIDIPIPNKPGTKFEFFYSRQNTKVTIKEYPTGQTSDLFDMAVEYYQAGGVVERRSGRVAPFGSFTLGAVRFAPKQDSYEGVALNDEWRFAMSLGAGFKSYFNERVGLRLQARLLMPMNFSGASLWSGTGGASAGVGGSSAILQGDAIAGLFVIF